MGREWHIGIYIFNEQDIQTAEGNGLDYKTCFDRVSKLGKTKEWTINTPKLTQWGVNKFDLTDEDYRIAKERGIGRKTLQSRLYAHDMPKDEAMSKPVKKTGRGAMKK